MYIALFLCAGLDERFDDSLMISALGDRERGRAVPGCCVDVGPFGDQSPYNDIITMFACKHQRGKTAFFFGLNIGAMRDQSADHCLMPLPTRMHQRRHAGQIRGIYFDPFRDQFSSFSDSTETAIAHPKIVRPMRGGDDEVMALWGHEIIGGKLYFEAEGFYREDDGRYMTLSLNGETLLQAGEPIDAYVQHTEDYLRLNDMYLRLYPNPSGVSAPYPSHAGPVEEPIKEWQSTENKVMRLPSDLKPLDGDRLAGIWRYQKPGLRRLLQY